MSRWNKAVLLMLALGLLIACQNQSATRVPSSVDQVPRITPKQVNDLFTRGETVLLVDARSRTSYDQAHIPNAISLPLDEIQAGDDSLPKDGTIVLYCT